MDTVNRELEEETGINLNIKEIKPFACAKGSYNNWPSKGKNRKIEIYYYEILTDELPKLEKLNLTENEKKGNFELRYIDLSNVEIILKENVRKYDDPHGITKEMLELFKIYKEYKNEDIEI